MGVPDGTTNGHGGSRAAKHNLPSHFIGGNHLDAAAPSSVKDFVANHEGHSVITSVSFAWRRLKNNLEAVGPATD